MAEKWSFSREFNDVSNEDIMDVPVRERYKQTGNIPCCSDCQFSSGKGCLDKSAKTLKYE